MKLEWDDAKAAKNIKKHQVSFELAALIFSDPFVMTIPDPEHSDEEDREISMGLEPQGKALVVVHTTRIREGTDWIRLISARKADKREQEVYYENRSRYEKTL